MRSFSNLWYWITVAGIWAVVGQRVLGVPYDMVIRARNQGGAAAQDLMEITRINVLRRIEIKENAGLFLWAAAAFVVALLIGLGVGYRFELAQAVLLVALPLMVVFGLSLNAAQNIKDTDPDAETLCQMLTAHKRKVQIIAFVALFLTSVWGVYVNLTTLVWY